MELYQYTILETDIQVDARCTDRELRDVYAKVDSSKEERIIAINIAVKCIIFERGRVYRVSCNR